ncbi:hypothetical protein A9Q90_10355 [Gammaproteobacteria bacterium 54_18_T64]|nr:hypothetical protein A9Q90_10355 [Gammaproteobacteria bacterium 54_18_T64]
MTFKPSTNGSRVHTLVIQSHRQPLPYTWLAPCIDSVKSWAKQKSYDYHFIDDEIFDTLPAWVLEKTQAQKVIATDLARLKCLQHYLTAGYRRIIWLDADFLIFAPDDLQLPKPGELPEGYALGREVWVQPKTSGQEPATNKALKFKAYKKVHNAFLLFDAQFGQRNSFLDFYSAHAERLLKQISGPMPPQFIGPKFLTALHNVVQCPVQENAGMLSPWVINDILTAGGPALKLFSDKSPQPLAGANLCSSLSNSDVLPEQAIERVVTQLLTQGSI